MNRRTVNLIEAEKKAKEITTKNHSEEFELLTRMLNLYTSGFSLIPHLNDKNSDNDWVWLFLITRSFLSIRCAIELMAKAYYAQAMALIRIVSEAYFLCGNCENDKTIADAVIHNKPNKADGRTIFNYKELAKKMDSLYFYENAYRHECSFSHTSSLSLGIMTTVIDSNSRELSPVPDYKELLFIDCCEVAFRNGLLMGSFVERLIDSVCKEKVNVWRVKAKPEVQRIEEWLDGLGRDMEELIEGVIGGLEVSLRAFWCKARGGGGRLRHATERMKKESIRWVLGVVNDKVGGGSIRLSLT